MSSEKGLFGRLIDKAKSSEDVWWRYQKSSYYDQKRTLTKKEWVKLEDVEKEVAKVAQQIKENTSNFTAELIQSNLEYLQENEPNKYNIEKRELWIPVSIVLGLLEHPSDSSFVVVAKNKLQEFYVDFLGDLEKHLDEECEWQALKVVQIIGKKFKEELLEK